MAKKFYHVDRGGNLEPGSELDLEWPSRLFRDVITFLSEKNQSALRELFPEGLSSHGARYAQAELVCKDDIELDEESELMVGKIYRVNPKEVRRETQYLKPYAVQYEFFLELYRQMKYEDERSRFQSYFAFEDLDSAKTFQKSHRGDKSRIIKVECENYERRDMDLVAPHSFGEIITMGEMYWNGEPGSDDPAWEMVLEPPVNVIEIIE